MSNVFHKDFIDDNNHAVTARTFADITARDADTAFQVTENINKIVRVNTPIRYFILVSIGPAVWDEVGGEVISDAIALNTTHRTSDGSDHGFIDQDVTISSSPTFDSLTLTGDFLVQGTTTTLDTTTLLVEDKNIELGVVGTPTDITADGGGITLKGTTDKTITWRNTLDVWEFNQGIQLLGSSKLSVGVTSPVQALEVFGTIISSNAASSPTRTIAITAGTGSIDASGATLSLNRFTTSATIIGGGGGSTVIGAGAGEATSIFTVTGTAQASIPAPRLTTTQRNAIASPVAGLQVYNTTTDKPEFFDGAWKSIGGDLTISGSVEDNAIMRADGTSGKVLQGSQIKINDLGDMSLPDVKQLTFGDSDDIVMAFGGSDFTTTSFGGGMHYTLSLSTDEFRWTLPTDVATIGYQVQDNNGDALFEILGDGKASFGVSPLGTAKLSVVDRISIATSISTALGVWKSNDPVGCVTFGTGQPTHLCFMTNDSERIRILSTGEVGIGLSSAMVGTNLTVRPATGSQRSVFEATGVNTSFLDIATLGQGKAVLRLSTLGFIDWGIGVGATGGTGSLDTLIFAAGGDINVGQRMSLTTLGQLGIRTEDPKSTLDVRGSFSLEQLFTFGSLVISEDDKSVYAIESDAAPTTITIQSAHIVVGRMFIIFDEGGNAGTNNITIETEGSEKISGQDNHIIAVDHGSVTMLSTGGKLTIV